MVLQELRLTFEHLSFCRHPSALLPTSAAAFCGTLTLMLAHCCCRSLNLMGTLAVANFAWTMTPILQS